MEECCYFLNGHTKIGLEPTEFQRFVINADFFENNGLNPTASDDVSSPNTVLIATHQNIILEVIIPIIILIINSSILKPYFITVMLM